MAIRNTIFTACLLLIASSSTFAGTRDKSNLLQIADLLKQKDGCAYTIDIITDLTRKNATHAKQDSSAQHAIETAHYYYSKVDKIQYLTSAEKCYLMCKQGYFNCDIANRLVHYKSFASDSMWNAYNEKLATVANVAMLDSLFFDHAQIKSKLNKGALTVYHLSYPKGSVIESAVVEFERQSKQIQSFSYTFSQTFEGDVRITKTIRMHHYSSAPPASLVVLLDALKPGFATYVQTHYASYTLKQLN